MSKNRLWLWMLGASILATRQIHQGSLQGSNEIAEPTVLQQHLSSSSASSVHTKSIMSNLNDFVITHTHFLPQGPAGQRIDKDLETSLLKELDELTSSMCHFKGRYPIQLRPMEWGFGATLNSLVKPVMHALKHGYCLQEPVNFHKYRCNQGWKELFAPLSLPSVVRNNTTTTFRKQNRGRTSQFCARILGKGYGYDLRGRPKMFGRPSYQGCVQEYSYSLKGITVLPAKYRPMGFFAFVSILMRRMFRPSVGLQDRIRREKNVMKWPSPGTPILGIHFRSGDACLETEENLGRKCESFDVYMQQANLLRQKYNMTHIYLATDSEELLESSLVDKYPGWTFLYIKHMDRGGQRHDLSVDILLARGLLDGCEEARNSLLDILLLSDCDGFVGKFSGNMDRIVYSLMSARTGQLRPYVSLDNSWCFDFGVKSRPSGLNTSNQQMYFC